MGSLLFDGFSANPHSSPVGGSNSLLSAGFPTAIKAKEEEFVWKVKLHMLPCQSYWTIHEGHGALFAVWKLSIMKHHHLFSHLTLRCLEEMVSTWCQPGVEPQPGVNLVSTHLQQK